MKYSNTKPPEHIKQPQMKKGFPNGQAINQITEEIITVTIPSQSKALG
jgi:hypothetical protein